MKLLKKINWNEPNPKTPFIYQCEFMMVNHNYICAICMEESAVIETSKWILHPCWQCQKNGWVIKRDLISRIKAWWNFK